MIRTRRLAAVLPAGAAALALLSAGPAFANSDPPPTSTAQFCPTDLQNGQTIQEPDGSVLFCVEALGAGAVVIQTIPAGDALQQVILAPGWDWTDKSGGSARHGKVDVEFDNATTGGKVEVRVEPGRTEVKGS